MPKFLKQPLFALAALLGVVAALLVAVAAGFGRAISEVGASLMVGGNIVGQTRILTTAIALETWGRLPRSECVVPMFALSDSVNVHRSDIA